MKVLSVNLSSDLPKYVSPDYVYTSGREFFIKYGEDNILPNHLIKLANESPTHSSLLHLKTILTAGEGFSYNSDNTSLTDYIDSIDLNNTLERISKDFVTYNGFALQVIWSRDAKTIADIQHLDFSTIRCENETKPQVYFVSPCWKDYRRSVNEPVGFPVFNPLKSKEQPIQILYYTNYSQTNFWYPVEDYRSTLNYIRLEAEISNFHLNNVQNGLISTGVFNFPYIPDEEERLGIKRSIKEQHTGTNNAGRFLLFFGENKDSLPDYKELPNNNNAKIYDTLNDITCQKIVSGHKLNSPSLAGLASNGSIFTNEISTAFEYFSKTIIKGYQKPIIKIFNRLFRINNLIKPDETVSISDLNPIQFKFSENVLQNVLTKNELRRELGYDPIEGGDQIASYSSSNNPAASNTVKPVQKPDDVNPKDLID